MKLFLCEKYSQAEDVAKGLGNPKRQKNYIQTDQGNVVWASGHLLELNEPEDYNPEFKSWNLETLPILPEKFFKKIKKQFRDRFKAIESELKKTQHVVIATDAGREGEMIGREILEYCNFRGDIKRLWASAMDVESMRKALQCIKSGDETITLHYAAEARAKADWIWGMNLTRALTIIQQAKGEKGVVSVGRVQTPTLALVVYRDREIKNFKSTEYFELTARVEANKNQLILRYAPKNEERILEREKVEKLAQSLKGETGSLSVEKKEMTKQPPRPFSLLKLQQKANNLWGWPSDKTQSVAQALYEIHKVTSYPRTDCDYLPEEQIKDIQPILTNLDSIAKELFPDLPEGFFKQLKENFTVRKSVYNTAKVVEHHAIIPTLQMPSWHALSEDEQNLLRLIVKVFVANFLQDYRYLQTKISLPAKDVVFVAIGNVPTELGWRVLFTKNDDEDKEEESNLPEIADGTIATIQEAEVNVKQTKPPEAYTDASLLGDMDKVAKFVTDPEKKAKLKDKGIGTGATRAAIIKTLKNRDFITVKGKKLLSTDKGRALIELLEKELPALVDVGETAIWEEKLSQIQNRELAVDQFINEMGNRVKEYLSTINGIAATLPQKTSKPNPWPILETTTTCPRSNKLVMDYGDHWRFPGYPNIFFNKNVCSRRMSLEDYIKILTSPDGVEFKGFVWPATGKISDGKLQFNLKLNKIEFVFKKNKKTNELVAAR